MSAKTCFLTNLAGRPVCFRGNSGESFHLAPRESGREVRALEVAGNAIVDKLVSRRVLAVAEKRAGLGRATRKATASKRTKPAKKAKKTKK